MNHFYLKFVPISNIFNKILDIFSLQIILKPMSNPHQNQTLIQVLFLTKGHTTKLKNVRCLCFPKKINDPCLALWNQNLLLFIAYLITKMKLYAVDT